MKILCNFLSWEGSVIHPIKNEPYEWIQQVREQTDHMKQNVSSSLNSNNNSLFTFSTVQLKSLLTQHNALLFWTRTNILPNYTMPILSHGCQVPSFGEKFQPSWGMQKFKPCFLFAGNSTFKIFLFLLQLINIYLCNFIILKTSIIVQN